MNTENTNPKPNPEKKPASGVFGGLWNKLKGSSAPAPKSDSKQGNALTEIMNQSVKKQSLVSNIIRNVKPKQADDDQTEINKVMLRDAEAQLFWGRIASAAVLVFLIVSLLVSWIWLGANNPVLSMIGKENLIKTGERVEKQLEGATKKYNKLKEENQALISQDSSKAAVVSKEITQSRIDWTAVMDQADEVILKVSPYNPVTNKIAIAQYSFSADDGKIVVNGLVQNESEDKIYNLTANMVDALEESPYFEGVEYNQYSMTEEEMGSFSAPLRATFYIQKEASNESDSINYVSTDYSKRRYRHDGFQFSTSTGESTEATNPTNN